MNNKKFILLALAMIMGIFAVAPSNIVSAQTANPLKNISLTDTTGTLTDAKFSVTRFAVQKGKVVATGTLTGTMNGKQINQAVTMPVTTGQHSCDILNLQLGPLDLNLLGLRVQLSQVNLDITAVPGSGNLLGNLLCEVAKLLDGNGNATGRLVKLLNDILGALG